MLLRGPGLRLGLEERRERRSRKERKRGRPLLTWLSSVSAAILSFGSIVPFSAWMIRLRSMSAGGSYGPRASRPGCSRDVSWPLSAPSATGDHLTPTPCRCHHRLQLLAAPL